ncbi:hypothetical protein I4U23_021004 [Adineta vaga]|nr:hypothetical protein I4U23_021004 [Adineta vaga]
MHTTTDRTHNLLQYSDRLGTYISKLFDEIIKKRNSFVRKKKMKYQQRYIIHRIYAVFICIFVLLIFLIMKSRNFSTIPNHPEGLKIYSVHQARYLLRNESMSLNIYEHTVQSVYIDIGCFNGETIEHFIHFTRNSILYDIITFEPDPVNYHLCKEKLSRAKYKDYNIFIIPEVAWIYNGKVSYRIDRGEKSGLYRKKSNKERKFI